MDQSSGRPLYLLVADDLRRAYQPGVQLDSVNDLAERWGAARETIRSAVDVLRREGLVISWQGRGTFYQAVEDREESTFSIATVMARLDDIVRLLDGMNKRLTVLERSVRR